MNSNRITTWLQIAANLGIVVGLVLVAVQIRQTSDQIRLQMIQDQAYKQVDGELALMGETTISAYARALTTPQALTEAEAMQLWSYLAATMVPAYVTWNSYRAGVVPADDWAASLDGYAFALDSPANRVLWKQMRGQYPEAFADEVDAVLAARARAASPNIPTMLHTAIAELRALPREEVQ
jgi:hypothetical protein